MNMAESGDLVRSCMAQSTAHGVTYIANGKTLLQRLAWLFFFLVACGGFGYFFYMYVAKYLAEPTTVTIQLKAIEYEPPDIHVCNLNALSQSRILEAQRLNSKEWQELRADVARIEMILRMLNVTDNQKAVIFFWSSMPRDKLFRVAGHWGQQSVLSVPTQSAFNFNYYSCVRYQPTDNDTDMRIASAWKSIYLYVDGYHLEKDLPIFFGKSLSDLNYVDPSLPRNPLGMALYFTPRNAYPFPETTSRLVGPGQFSVINLRMEKSEACPTYKWPCQVDTTHVSYFNSFVGGNATIQYVKTFESCKYATQLRNMMTNYRDCDCIRLFLSVQLELARRYPVCGNITEAFLQQPRNLTYLKEVADQVECGTHYLDDGLKFNSADCEKERPCSSVRYIPAMSTVRWTDSHLVEAIIERQLRPLYRDLNVTLPGLESFFQTVDRVNDSMKNDLTQNNFAYVMVSAGETHSTRITEELSYDVQNVVSDVGGIAGLFLGVSFLTFVEVLNLIHDLTVLCITQRRRVF